MLKQLSSLSGKEFPFFLILSLFGFYITTSDILLQINNSKKSPIAWNFPDIWKPGFYEKRVSEETVSTLNKVDESFLWLKQLSWLSGKGIPFLLITFLLLHNLYCFKSITVSKWGKFLTLWLNFEPNFLLLTLSRLSTYTLF